MDFINNIPNKIIQPVCQGVCDYKFFVNPPTGGCLDLTYVWTLDGADLKEDKNEIELDFPDEGDFELCVTAYAGNPKNNSICAQVGPQCATVKVRPLSDRNGSPRTLCYEDIALDGFKWHTQLINSSGVYRETFTQTNCCKYDSVVEFTVLPEIESQEVLYISCDNIPYRDPNGFKYPLCADHLLVGLPRSTERYKCDSTILLTSINVGLKSKWTAQCLGTQVELAPNIQLIDTCSVRGTNTLDYKWYLKADTAKQLLGSTAKLSVDTISKDYCVDVSVKVKLGTDSAVCVKTFCDTINEASSGVSTQNMVLRYCDSATFNGQTYYQTTSLTKQLKTALGCDSIINTELNIQNSSKTDLILGACDSLKVNGQIYNQSGDYTQFLQSMNLCDSILDIHATIAMSKFESLFLFQCDSAIINKQVYTQTGNYIQVLKTVDGCDSTLNIDLNISNSIRQDLSYQACDSIEISGQVYKQSGDYVQKLLSIEGCDSIVNLQIDIHSSSQTDISKTDCDSVVFNGKTYKQTGDYTERYTSANGCDSIVVLHVNIPNSNTSPLVLSRCDSITINGQHYTKSGSYSQKLISANGCDSILNIDLTIETASQANISRTGCDTVVINNMTYTQSGLYQQKLQTAAGCDSTLNIDLNIVKSSSGDTLFYSCDSIKVNGITYHQSGIYKQTLTNTNQCDSTLVIDFTRLSKSSTALSYKSCDSVVVNQQVYKQSGKYTQTFVNANQCDSTLNLNIEISKSNSANINLSSCDSTRLNGQLYIQSGNYTQTLTNTDQCDSLLNINLTVNKSSSINYSFSTCDSATINGQIYKQSGNYTQYLKSVNQCDSIINIKLTLSKSNLSTFAQEACDSIQINGTPYYTSGNYQQKLTTNNGCDSTLTLALTIKPGNPSTLDAGKDTSICEGAILQLNGIFSGPASFNWQSSSGSFDHPNNLNTNYYSDQPGKERIYLQATDECKEWLDSFAIQILPNQFVQVTGDTIIDPCKEKEITFIASGGTNYTWTPSSNIVCLDPPCSQVKLRSNVAARFTITTDGSCAFSAQLNLSESQIQSDVYFPTTFSPNGDNINDIFIPIFNCEQVTFYNLQIYDRWGNLMFESKKKDLGWNGKHNGVILNPGVYIYVMEYELHNTDRKVKGGDVTLIR